MVKNVCKEYQQSLSRMVKNVCVNNVNGVWERMFVNNVNSDYEDY